MNVHKIFLNKILKICSLGPFDSASEARRDLHMASDRTSDHLQNRCNNIQFLVLESAPPYLCDLINAYQPRRALRSDIKVILGVP